MIEFHNSIIYIPTLLDQRHRGRGLQIFGELPRENEGPATVIRNILALLFLRRNQMIELNQISVTNRSYCNTSRKNLVDNASCVWIVVLLQNIDDLIVHIYLARKVDQKRIVPVFLSDKPIRPKIFVQLLKSDFLKFDLLIVNLYYLSSSLLKEVNAVTVIHAKICLQVEPVLPVMLFVTCQKMQDIDWQDRIRYSR